MRILFAVTCILLLPQTLYSQEPVTARAIPECAVRGNDLVDRSAPRFEQYRVKRSSPFRPAKLDLQSNPIARRYRTVIRDEMTHGPNFAGHYRVVFWGCGTSCSQFALVNLKTGHVITLNGTYAVAYVDFDTNDFLPKTDSKGYGFRYKRNSNLLVLVGTLISDNPRKRELDEGASYYILKDEELRLVHRTPVRHRTCQDY